MHTPKEKAQRTPDYLAEIIAYIRKYTLENEPDHLGPRYVDMTRHFEHREKMRWTHGTFQKYLTAGQEAELIEKRIDGKTGRPRYYIKKGKETEVERIVTANDIEKSCFYPIMVPRETIERTLRRLEEIRHCQVAGKAGLLTKLKMKRKEMEFFRSAELHNEIERLIPTLSMSIFYPPLSSPPEIPEWGYEYLAAVAFASRTSSHEPEKFQIVVNCDFSKCENEGTIALTTDKSLFIRWAKEVEGIKIDDKVIPYLWPEEVGLDNKDFAGSDDKKGFYEYLVRCKDLQMKFLEQFRRFLEAENEMIGNVIKQGP